VAYALTPLRQEINPRPLKDRLNHRFGGRRGRVLASLSRRRWHPLIPPKLAPFYRAA